MIQTTQIDKSKAFVIGTDSEETIRKKIAYRNKTIPQYIAIDPIVTQTQREDRGTSRATDVIRYTNILDVAGTYDNESQYLAFYNTVQPII